uniref:SHSP domain-containing protein n=1 Tax=Oryza punctata TaxID=4537 RepID=A0A0E0MCU1_ORYPU
MSLSAVSSCHSLMMSRPVKLAAAAPLGSWKPPAAVVGVTTAGKMKMKMKRPSICFAYDPNTSKDQFNISPVALVHPTMPPTSTAQWKIDDKDKSVQLTFFNIPEKAKEGDFQVVIEDDVLIVKTKTADASAAAGVGGEAAAGENDVSFHVRLLMPKGYNKDGVRAELVLRALVVTVGKAGHPEFKKEIAVERK